MSDHDYRKRYCGHDYTFEPRNNGKQATMLGWGCGIRKGDVILMNSEHSPDKTIRYKVRQITYFDNPSDMWKAEVRYLKWAYADGKPVGFWPAVVRSLRSKSDNHPPKDGPYPHRHREGMNYE